jgi:protein TonB
MKADSNFARPVYWQGADRIGPTLAGSAAAHVAFAVLMVLWAWWFGSHHGQEWGSSFNSAGAIQATLVSNAPSVPIPSPQTPTDNVLATETPSPAPAPPAPAAKAAPPPDAIPIPEKIKQPEKAPPKPAPVPPNANLLANVPPATRPLTHPIPIPKTENRANFGEAAPANIPRQNPVNSGNGTVNVAGDFGSRFGWYVDIIKRKAQQSWYKAEVDPKTAAGVKVYVTFNIARDGTPSQVRIEKSSGSPSLDSSALRAMQRVDTFGPLPAGYNGRELNVEYYFEF